MLRALLEKKLQAIWYDNAAGADILSPLESLYATYAVRKRRRFINGQMPSYRAAVPVVIVGNLVLGGAGKTPLVLAISQHLQQQGWRPGILSRGYKAAAQHFPRRVRNNDSAADVGDEPLLLAQRSNVPVCIDPLRARGAGWLVANTDCDVLLCDDGLQHYALQRDVEIVVVDTQRQLGNRRCLPAGPLREPAERLNSVDFVVQNCGVNTVCDAEGMYAMRLQPSRLVRLRDEKTVTINDARDIAAQRPVHAVTGIGNPQRFFESLRTLGFNIIEHVFPDHHPFSVRDLQFGDEQIIIMTEKDAVKCRPFAPDQAWYLAVEALVEEDFLRLLLTKIERARKQLS